MNLSTGSIDDDFEEYDDEPTAVPTMVNGKFQLLSFPPRTASSILPDSTANTEIDEWTFESPKRGSTTLPSTEHDLSRKPSTMSSSSRSSKRGHDEIEFDEDEDEGGYPQGSPGMFLHAFGETIYSHLVRRR